MGKDKFCGQYFGKYKKTVREGSSITNSKGKGLLTITQVGDGAYLCSTTSDNATFNDLAYLEDDILKGELGSGDGIFSIYFKDNKLIFQLSEVSSTFSLIKNYKYVKCDKYKH